MCHPQVQRKLETMAKVVPVSIRKHVLAGLGFSAFLTLLPTYHFCCVLWALQPPLMACSLRTYPPIPPSLPPFLSCHSPFCPQPCSVLAPDASSDCSLPHSYNKKPLSHTSEQLYPHFSQLPHCFNKSRPLAFWASTVPTKLYPHKKIHSLQGLARRSGQ